MRRTLILGTISAIALTVGLGVHATFASGTSLPTGDEMITMMDTANRGNMPDADDMTSMMGGVDMTNMMDTDGMNAMHTAMHEALRGSAAADLLAACDLAHGSMPSSMPSSADFPSGHAEHHPGVQP